MRENEAQQQPCVSLFPLGNYYMVYDDKRNVQVVQVKAARLPSFSPGTKIEPEMIGTNTIDVDVFHRQREQQQVDCRNVIESAALYVFKAKTHTSQSIQIQQLLCSVPKEFAIDENTVVLSQRYSNQCSRFERIMIWNPLTFYISLLPRVIENNVLVNGLVLQYPSRLATGSQLFRQAYDRQFGTEGMQNDEFQQKLAEFQDETFENQKQVIEKINAVVNNVQFSLKRPSDFLSFRDKCIAEGTVAVTERILQLPIRPGTYNQLAILDKYLRKNKLTGVALDVPQFKNLLQAITHSRDLMLTEAAIKSSSELYRYSVRFDQRFALHSGCALTRKATHQCYPLAVFLNCQPFIKIYQVGENPIAKAYALLAEVIAASDDIRALQERLSKLQDNEVQAVLNGKNEPELQGWPNIISFALYKQHFAQYRLLKRMANKTCSYTDSELVPMVYDNVLQRVLEACPPACVEDLGPRLMLRLRPSTYCKYLEELLARNEETHELTVDQFHEISAYARRTENLLVQWTLNKYGLWSRD